MGMGMGMGKGMRLLRGQIELSNVLKKWGRACVRSRTFIVVMTTVGTRLCSFANIYSCDDHYKGDALVFVREHL